MRYCWSTGQFVKNYVNSVQFSYVALYTGRTTRLARPSVTYTLFTRSRKHQANIEQMYSKYMW